MIFPLLPLILFFLLVLFLGYWVASVTVLEACGYSVADFLLFFFIFSPLPCSCYDCYVFIGDQ